VSDLSIPGLFSGLHSERDRKKHPHQPYIRRGEGGDEMKLILKLFVRADGGDSAFDVVAGDAKEILGQLAMATLTHTGICRLVLDGAILSCQFKGIVAGCARFRPPIFTLEKNGIVFGAFGFHGNFAWVIIGFPGAGLPLGLEVFEFPGGVGVNSFLDFAGAIDTGKGKHPQKQN
jgi:hypothetical protein